MSETLKATDSVAYNTEVSRLMSAAATRLIELYPQLSTLIKEEKNDLGKSYSTMYQLNIRYGLTVHRIAHFIIYPNLSCFMTADEAVRKELQLDSVAKLHNLNGIKEMLDKLVSSNHVANIARKIAGLPETPKLVYNYYVEYSSTEYDTCLRFAEPEEVLQKMLETQQWIRSFDGYWINVSKIRAIKNTGTAEVGPDENGVMRIVVGKKGESNE